jgi:glycine betaine/choline ABC-type transport system substrate-binding protein
VVREEVASDELGALLDSVTTTLTDENMREMVGQILNDKRDVSDVAEEYLTNAGIL